MTDVPIDYEEKAAPTLEEDVLRTCRRWKDYGVVFMSCVYAHPEHNVDECPQLVGVWRKAYQAYGDLMERIRDERD